MTMAGAAELHRASLQSSRISLSHSNAGLVPAIHVFLCFAAAKDVIGTPGMTS
jgi:hypothetical protein